MDGVHLDDIYWKFFGLLSTWGFKLFLRSVFVFIEFLGISFDHRGRKVFFEFKILFKNNFVWHVYTTLELL